MILIFTNKITYRIKYVFTHIFRSILGIKVQFTSNIEEFIAYEGPKISYAKKKLGAELFFEAHTLLFERGIRKDIEFSVDFKEEVPYFFKTSNESALSYDLFASSFYLITRYEEYLPSVLDRLGRFQAKESLAFKNGFLQIPVVNLWANEIFEKIKEKYPEIKTRRSAFSFINVLTIHEAFKYAQKGIGRTISSILRDLYQLKFREIKSRFQVILKMQKDPFNQFDFLLNIHRKNQLKSIFFFSIGDPSKYDRNISIERKAYGKLIKSVGDDAFVGVNYSMQSTNDIHVKRAEKRKMEAIIHRPISRAQQHLFKLNLPFTYRDMAAIGIKKDFSMGYYDTIGFRAGTCTPFFFYDLRYESLTPLKVFPFAFTDKALKIRYGNDRKKIKQEILSLIMTVKEFNGLFTSVFHNKTFSKEVRWHGWKDIYLDFIKTIKIIQDEK